MMMKPISDKIFGTVILILISVLILVLAFSVISGGPANGNNTTIPVSSGAGEITRFASDADFLEAFKKGSASSQSNYWLEEGGWFGSGFRNAVPQASKSDSAVTGSVSSLSSGSTYSTTNVQVAGVDEADLVKSDGEYIYIISKGRLVIVKAYPAGEARQVSSTEFSGFSAKEIFIDGDRLMVFGVSYNRYTPKTGSMGTSVGGVIVVPPERHYVSLTTVKLYDISDRSKPKQVRSFDMEGAYETARLIGHTAYFVVNSPPAVYYSERITATDVVPLCRENDADFAPIAKPTEIGCIPPAVISSFTTVAAMSMIDEKSEITKEIVAGSGQTVYASQKSMYVVQGYSYPYYRYGGTTADEKTSIAKFDLSDGKIRYISTGKVKGHLLNQFSMDESGGYFRVATTIGEVWNSETPSKNNVYVLDSGMDVVGSLEDLAPGEKIYSVRFMGSRCYMVTFKKVDPLFVIDLSDPKAPKVLGKLKIPGYSDYLHPYDENHIIGIGKDAIDASESETSSRNLDFAWYQGVKMAIFDVSDVEHPKELYKVTIGDRGTDSPVLTDHRAFLFDREKGLLVLPLTVAEIRGERTSDNQYGDYVFQGAYVYDVSLDRGFQLRGKVTQYDSDDVFRKSGYYFYGDKSITRSMYIRNVLYTLSSGRLQLNDLYTLEKLKAIEL